ncbi:hypothetical protein LF41_1154 [Lysobacter dokdonensis DS-58]|uniref:STAS/SEC14 domain-containing protein n=1 Tax=Lysobacter dokdonensis DS-58 TaxID=1300345 RepID=A0A0A2WPF1_9GAMM|nr:hypothetical protein LF41_1154 [Lysobacter dokdonensis DS-58]
MTYADRRRAMEKVCETAAARGIARFLVDFTLAWHVVGDPLEKEAFFQALSGRHELAGARIAYVNCPEGSISELHAAADALGFSAGMFRDRSRAIEWLKHGAVAEAPPRPLAFGVRQ